MISHDLLVRYTSAIDVKDGKVLFISLFIHLEYLTKFHSYKCYILLFSLLREFNPYVGGPFQSQPFLEKLNVTVYRRQQYNVVIYEKSNAFIHL